MPPGGSLNKNHVDEGALDYLIDRYGPKTMLDLGCSTGDTVRLAQSKGIAAEGVDGDVGMLEYWYDCGCQLHNFAKPWRCRAPYWDLVWCVEFVEHLSLPELQNALDVIRGCDYAVLTSSPKKVSWHQNPQPLPYWEGMMAAIGFQLDEEATVEIRRASTMKKDFMREFGQVFYAI